MKTKLLNYLINCLDDNKISKKQFVEKLKKYRLIGLFNDFTKKWKNY